MPKLLLATLTSLVTLHALAHDYGTPVSGDPLASCPTGTCEFRPCEACVSSVEGYSKNP